MRVPKLGVVEFAAAHIANFAQHFVALFRQLSTQPLVEKVFDGIRQVQHIVTGKLRPGFGTGF
jgi:hypothetical protein